jgi:hypothetical protein
LSPPLGAVAGNQFACGYKVDISGSNGRVVFPVDKLAAKRLLRFLNEELLREAISETLYETNSNLDTD